MDHKELLTKVGPKDLTVLVAKNHNTWGTMYYNPVKPKTGEKQSFYEILKNSDIVHCWI